MPTINASTEESNTTKGNITEQVAILSPESNVSLTTSNISADINSDHVQIITDPTTNTSPMTISTRTTSIQVPATNSPPINTGPTFLSAPSTNVLVQSITTEPIGNSTSSTLNSGVTSTETGPLSPSGYISNAPTRTTTSLPSTNGPLTVHSVHTTISSPIIVSTTSIKLTTLTPQLCNCGKGAICQVTSSISAICICQSGYQLNSSGACVGAVRK